MMLDIAMEDHYIDCALVTSWIVHKALKEKLASYIQAAIKRYWLCRDFSVAPVHGHETMKVLFVTFIVSRA